MSECHGCVGCAAVAVPPGADPASSHVVALVGPPNSGKSTLFNRLTGMRQKVANFPGVTVEQHVGKAKLGNNREITVIDLPGVYSLDARSEDERVTRDVLAGTMPGVPKPDVVLLILDCTNLGRHLLLAAPILALGLPTLVILNMADDLAARGGSIDIAELACQLGAPVALISAAKGDGVSKVVQFIEGTGDARGARPAAKVLLPVLNDIPKCRTWAQQVGNGAGYQAPEPPLWTRRLDSIFLHPVAGPVIFVAVVLGVFQTIFSGAKPMMDWLQKTIEAGGGFIFQSMPDSILRSFLLEGVFRGVGSVVVFLPQILLLYLFIGILEDSGYLARAALIADRTMASFGLQGKSFIPLISAHACAVPAIMATRTIENKRDRLATILIAPLMTCSARLPVYLLLIAAFIEPKRLLGPITTQAAVLLGLYVLGFVAAVATARMLKSSILKSERSSFMLEMPPYRWPTVRSLALRLYDRARVFLVRAGTVIFVVALGLWVTAHLPLKDGHAPDISDSFAGMVGHSVEPVLKPLGFNWKIGIGLITSLAAREVIVGTLGEIYGIEGADYESQGLQKALRSDLTPGGAVALLIFFAFAMQCMSTIAVVRRESGGWKWPVLQFTYMSFLAYAAAFVTNQLLLPASPIALLTK